MRFGAQWRRRARDASAQLEGELVDEGGSGRFPVQHREAPVIVLEAAAQRRIVQDAAR
jgi:hypothetical protein